MINDRLMPPPPRIYSRVLWDVRALDDAIDDLAGVDDNSGPEDNEWDGVLKK